MSTTKKNSIILEGAAVYAVSLDSSLRRLQTEYDALMAAKRYNEAKAKWDAGLFKYGPLKEDKDK